MKWGSLNLEAIARRENYLSLEILTYLISVNEIITEMNKKEHRNNNLKIVKSEQYKKVNKEGKNEKKISVRKKEIGRRNGVKHMKSERGN